MVLVAALAACKDAPPAGREPPGELAPPAATAPATEPARPPADAQVPTSPDRREDKIRIRIMPPRAPGSELARRCTFEGDPLTSSCVGGSHGLAPGPDGTLFVIADDKVHRYTRAGDGGECRYRPRGAAIPLPPDVPRPQTLGSGPVYMRSGGPAWHLARSGARIYAFDFLGGLYRVDRGKAEPACTEVFGYRSLATRRGKLLVARRHIEQLVLGKAGRCKAVPAPGYPAPHPGEIHVIGDQVYLTRGRKLEQLDGAEPKQLAHGADLCYATDLAACGDGVCVLDGNCKKLVQLDARGEVVRTIDGDALFATYPLGVREAVTLDTGAMLVLALHRDAVAGTETCEHTVYELPAAVFAR